MTTLHANALLIGNKGLLIIGASGAGKSHLCWQLLNDNSLFTRLISDDRTHLTAHHNRLIATAPKTIEGMMELRQQGITKLAFEKLGQIGFVIELGVSDALRLPLITDIEINGIRLPFCQLPPHFDAFSFVKSLINLDLLH